MSAEAIPVLAVPSVDRSSHGPATLPRADESNGRLQESGRVEQRVVAVANWPVDSDKCGRSDEDASAEMGTACTRPDGRVLTALGMLKAALMRFEARRE